MDLGITVNSHSFLVSRQKKKLLNALIHVPEGLAPPVGTVSELSRPAEELASSLAAFRPNSSQSLCAQLLVHKTLQRLQIY